MNTNTLLVLLCNLVILGSATYVRQPGLADAKKPVEQPKMLVDEAEKSQLAATATDPRPFFLERYSPEVARILMNPRLMAELYEALQYQQQQQQQQQPSEELEAPSKRAQTFVRFGKRAQTFVRFG